MKKLKEWGAGVNKSFDTAFSGLGKDLSMAVKAAHNDIRHLSGLPVPEGVPCYLEVTPAELGIRAGGQNFRVPTERIVSVQEYNDTEMRQHIGSSFGSTVLGGAAFGGLGAVIGAMPKSKYKKAVSKHNLVVNYVSEAGEAKVLAFSSDQSLGHLAREIRKYGSGEAPGGVTTL